MRYSFDQLESFYWVAHLGGFRAAARQQHLSQPTVSARIHELERILGNCERRKENENSQKEGSVSHKSPVILFYIVVS